MLSCVAAILLSSGSAQSQAVDYCRTEELKYNFSHLPQLKPECRIMSTEPSSQIEGKFRQFWKNNFHLFSKDMPVFFCLDYCSANKICKQSGVESNSSFQRKKLSLNWLDRLFFPPVSYHCCSAFIVVLLSFI